MSLAFTGSRIVALVLVSGVWTAACGDDDGGGVSTGLPQDQPLSELDDGDVRMACEAAADGLDGVLSADERKRIECTGQALPLSINAAGSGQPQVDVGECRDLVQRCVGGEEIGESADAPALDLDFSSDVDCAGESMTAQFDDCDATVGQYEDCLNAVLAEMDRFFAMIDCDALADVESQDSLGGGLDLASLPACETLADQCPDVDLGGSSEGNPDAGEPPANGCEDTCVFANDDECDDGGPDSDTPACELGTDCADCGTR